MERMDESELIGRSKKGDVAAFNVLVEQHQSLAYNVALRMLGDAPAAEDITQDAFVSAFKHIGQLRGGNFRSWLLRIVTNACLDAIRSRTRHMENSLDGLSEEWESAPLMDDAETPEELVLRRELSAHIQEGLLSLPPDQRTAVVLVDLQGLSYEEVAEITRSSLGTVKSRISRGRARMRDFLLQERELLPRGVRLMSKNQEK